MNERIYFVLAGGIVFAFCFAVIADAVSTAYSVPSPFYGLLGIIFGGSTAKGWLERARKSDDHYRSDEDRPPWDY